MNIILKHLQNIDIALTKELAQFCKSMRCLRSFRVHGYLFDASCNGFIWLTSWLCFTFAFDGSELRELQMNMLVGLLLDIIVVYLLKAYFGRRRPKPIIAFGPDEYSLPSGHSSRAAFVAYFFIYLYPLYYIFYPPLLAWVTFVCLSKISSGKHYIFDVLAGVLCGICEGIVIGVLWCDRAMSEDIITFLFD